MAAKARHQPYNERVYGLFDCARLAPSNSPYRSDYISYSTHIEFTVVGIGPIAFILQGEFWDGYRPCESCDFTRSKNYQQNRGKSELSHSQYCISPWNSLPSELTGHVDITESGIYRSVYPLYSLFVTDFLRI